MANELGFLLHFIPSKYIRMTLLPATNAYGKLIFKSFEEVTFEELIVFLGLIYSMEIVKLPERRLYWKDLASSFMPNMKFAQYLSLKRFEQIARVLKFSILEFLEAVNERLLAALVHREM